MSASTRRLGLRHRVGGGRFALGGQVWVRSSQPKGKRMREQMDKRKLLDEIQIGHMFFKALLTQVGGNAMVRPGIIGEWSVQDLVAHIVVHEQRMLEWMAARLRGDTPALPQPYAMPDDALAQLNEAIYQENRSRTLGDVLHDLDETHSQALALVEEAREEDLVDVRRFRLLGGEPLWRAVAANTYEHYEEHGKEIHAWLVS